MPSLWLLLFLSEIVLAVGVAFLLYLARDPLVRRSQRRGRDRNTGADRTRTGGGLTWSVVGNMQDREERTH